MEHAICVSSNGVELCVCDKGYSGNADEECLGRLPSLNQNLCNCITHIDKQLLHTDIFTSGI